MARRKRTPRDVRVPTLVALEVTPELGIQMHLAINGIAEGWAGTDQFDALAECCEMLSSGAVLRQDQAAQNVAEAASKALLSIKARYQTRRRIGATGDELNTLRALVNYSEDWWKRQGGSTFANAYALMRAEQARAA